MAAYVSTARQEASLLSREVFTLERPQLAVRYVNLDASAQMPQAIVLLVVPEASQHLQMTVSPAPLGQAIVCGVGQADSVAVRLLIAPSVVLGPWRWDLTGWLTRRLHAVYRASQGVIVLTRPFNAQTVVPEPSHQAE